MSIVASAAPAITDVERNARVVSNMGLAHRESRRFRGRGVDLEDLVQAAILGLIEAAGRFDPGRGLKFSTYATFSIRRFLFKAVASAAGPIRLPARARREAAQLRRRSEALAAERGSPPSPGEVLDAMAPVASVRERLYGVILASAPPADARAVEEVTAPGSDPLAGMIHHEHRDQLRLAMQLLSEGQREVITLRHGLDGKPALTITATAALLGQDVRFIRRREAAAMSELRRLLNRPAG